MQKKISVPANTSNQRRPAVSRDEIREQRRLRNIESAKRSRARLSGEAAWMAVQMSENEDKIKHLERVVETLSTELEGNGKKRSSEKSRPSARSSYHSKSTGKSGEPF